MTDIRTAISGMKASLCREVDVGALISRNNIAHKWKVPWRALLLRESVAWRLLDLVEQSRQLSSASGLLGARVLLRSSFETLAMLVYLNKAMRSVAAGSMDFHGFTGTTSRLLLGSRDKSTSVESINILTVLRVSRDKARNST